MRVTYYIKKNLLYIALILLATVCLLPFMLMIVNSTRSGLDIMTKVTLIPGNAFMENYHKVFNYFNLFRGLANSLVVAVPVTILTGYFSALTAFALAVYDFRGKKLLFLVIIVFMMIPAQLGLIGFYNLVVQLKMVDSYFPLIIPAIAAPGVVFFMRQYIISVLSPTLLEAARMDAAGELRIFHKIVLPIIAPGIATMSIGVFIASWNNYLTPLILLNSPDRFTLPVMIASLNGSTDIKANQGAIYLSISVSVIPILIAFAFCSKYIISSVTAGAVKE